MPRAAIPRTALPGVHGPINSPTLAASLFSTESTRSMFEGIKPCSLTLNNGHIKRTGTERKVIIKLN